jgi:lipopolysaccharide biosynthesis glycosyltransferase
MPCCAHMSAVMPPDVSDDRRVRVVVATDRRYLMPTAVALKSVEQTLPADYRMDAFVLHDNIDTTSMTRVNSSMEASRTNLNWCSVSDALDSHELPMGSILSKAHTRTVWADLFIGLLLPEDWRRVLYLDSDTMTASSVAPLWELDLLDATVGAVQDVFVPYVSSPYGIRNWETFDMHPRTPYFNSGVMLVDLDRWRSERVLDRSLEYITGYFHSITQYDQEVLNITLHGRWRLLDSRWNFTVWREEQREKTKIGMVAGSHARIHHFAGRTKPWNGAEPHLESVRRYFSILDKTWWSGWRPQARDGHPQLAEWD